MARTPPVSSPTSNAGGFTLLEVVIVLALGLLLLDIAVGSLSTVRTAASVESAEYSFRSLQAGARAHAIDRGFTARVELDLNEDMARVIVDSDTVEVVDLGAQYGVDVTARVDGSSVSRLVQCMTSRGIADGACTTFSAPANIVFSQGDRTRTIRLLPLGQVMD